MKSHFGLLTALLLAAAWGCSQPASDSATPASATPSSAISASADNSSAQPELPTPPPVAPAPPPPPPLVTLADSGPIQAIDLHVDTPWKVHFKERPPTLPEGHATMAMLRDGHYAAIVYPIYIPDYIHKNNPAIQDAEDILATVQTIIAKNDLLHAASDAPCPADKVCAFISIEGAGAFAQDINAIDGFIKRGVRLIGPVHAHNNALASSATGTRDNGLSAIGKDFCARVYAAGALIDVSHMSDRSISDLIPIAQKFGAPIVATHSNARALAPNPRNLSDAQLRAIADSGGVAGLNLHSPFVHTRGNVSLKHVVAQVMHMVKIAGAEHVAIGSDYDGGNPVPALSDASKLPKLAQALLDAGMSDADVRKIFAKNALRMLLWKPPQDG